MFIEAMMHSLWTLPLAVSGFAAVVRSEREFRIDYDNNCFVKDGKPFQIISGSMNYFNVPELLWADRLRSLKLCGLNTVQTYVEWRTFEPVSGNFTYTGRNDFVKYIKTAQEQGLLVGLRLGPYVDSGRDMGGLPWWILRASSKMALRTSFFLFIHYAQIFLLEVSN